MDAAVSLTAMIIGEIGATKASDIKAKGFLLSSAVMVVGPPISATAAVKVGNFPSCSCFKHASLLSLIVTLQS
jgi:hypothetical protein